MTPGGKQQAERRAKFKDNPEYKNQQAMYQQFWALANKDRKKEINRSSAQRTKTWIASKGKFSK